MLVHILASRGIDARTDLILECRITSGEHDGGRERGRRSGRKRHATAVLVYRWVEGDAQADMYRPSYVRRYTTKDEADGDVGGCGVYCGPAPLRLRACQVPAAVMKISSVAQECCRPRRVADGVDGI